MKGTVVATWVITARKLWGDNIAEQAMKRVGWPPDKIFMPTEDVEDTKPKNFAKELCSLAGKSEDEIWLAIGKDNDQTCFQD